MPHYTPLITTLVAAFTLAWVFAAVAQRLKLPPLVGYLLAGIVIGPFTPGYVADQNLASQLAEGEATVAATTLLALAAALVFGIVPALQCTRPALAGTLKDGARGASAGPAAAFAALPVGGRAPVPGTPVACARQRGGEARRSLALPRATRGAPLRARTRCMGRLLVLLRGRRGRRGWAGGRCRRRRAAAGRQ